MVGNFSFIAPSSDELWLLIPLFTHRVLCLCALLPPPSRKESHLHVNKRPILIFLLRGERKIEHIEQIEHIYQIHYSDSCLLELSVCDDLYHACTFAWDKLCALFTPH